MCDGQCHLFSIYCFFRSWRLLESLDDNILCELNLASCITYNIAIGCDKDDLDALYTSLTKHSPLLNDNNVESNLDEDLKLTSRPCSEEGRLSLVETSKLQYGTWTALPLLKDDRSMNQELIGRLSYDIVSSSFLSHQHVLTLIHVHHRPTTDLPISTWNPDRYTRRDIDGGNTRAIASAQIKG
jgi:hypothetical protein